MRIMPAMRTPSNPHLLRLALGAIVASVFAAFVACADPDTQTPTCVPNVGEAGINSTIANGCEQFAVCEMGPPAACCVNADGGALTGNDLATCLHGYGDPSCVFLLTMYTGDGGNNVIYTCSTTPPMGTGGSSSTTTTTTSSSGTGPSDGGGNG
jgi:hypothetical protein